MRASTKDLRTRADKGLELVMCLVTVLAELRAGYPIRLCILVAQSESERDAFLCGKYFLNIAYGMGGRLRSSINGTTEASIARVPKLVCSPT